MSDKYEYLTDSKNGFKIMYDPISSHTATHFMDKSDLKETAKKVLANIELNGNVVGTDIDCNKPIGFSDVVEVDSTDETYYAMRLLREDQGYVQFTTTQNRKRSNYLSVHLEKRDASTYELMSCWVGQYESPPFPQMKNATSDSKEFWSMHAFVAGSQDIIPGSIIKNCPW